MAIGQGPFLWFSARGSPWGYHSLPPAGMCISAFVFVTRGDEVLLGKYRNDPRWEAMAGLDEGRRLAHGKGWTIPASHLKYGEDPREAARRVAHEILGLPEGTLRLSEPRVEVEVGVPVRFPEVGDHYDMWFFVDAEWTRAEDPKVPDWFVDLRFVDPRALKAEEWGRSHEDVMARWLQVRTR